MSTNDPKRTSAKVSPKTLQLSLPVGGHRTRFPVFLSEISAVSLSVYAVAVRAKHAVTARLGAGMRPLMRASRKYRHRILARAYAVARSFPTC